MRGGLLLLLLRAQCDGTLDRVVQIGHCEVEMDLDRMFSGGPRGRWRLTTSAKKSSLMRMGSLLNSAAQNSATGRGSPSQASTVVVQRTDTMIHSGPPLRRSRAQWVSAAWIKRAYAVVPGGVRWSPSE